MTAVTVTEKDRSTPLDSHDLESRLTSQYGDMDALDLLKVMITNEFDGRIAILSSFGAEAAVLLDLVAQVDRHTPVLFINTLRHFPETLNYVDTLVDHLGLTNLIRISPDPEDAERRDPIGDLCRQKRDACCTMRKVEPLEKALDGFDAWVTGRKRHHGDLRADLPKIEHSRGRIKVNPIADWDADRIERTFVERNLPRHPMVEDGFLSIACMSCTTRAVDGEGVRSGRWAGSEKTECGIHSGPKKEKQK